MDETEEVVREAFWRDMRDKPRREKKERRETHFDLEGTNGFTVGDSLFSVVDIIVVNT